MDKRSTQVLPVRRVPEARPLCWLALVPLFGCASVAKLDELYIDRDAATNEDAGTDAGEPEPIDDPNAALRDLCVDTINTHRASESLPPLARASDRQEGCADEGAETDSAMNMPHYAAQNRSSRCQHLGLGPENTCPTWHFGAGTAYESAADALVACIQRMWDQGMPPIPAADCALDLEPGGCFALHGDWINMTDSRVKFVACGFALQGDDALWINQDFTAR